ncbi:MAG: hypothetical protein R3280_14690 [Marinobacter sp.]|uniref:hypothetical protein n=1 Tax=Marinobacter sp. TaxID=50741 RepID=UPI00299E5DD7|nr:hypothetical protein [Marinobacter sp.]MDX1635884.1 hypothetical protein [Marinobacter sp.]
MSNGYQPVSIATEQLLARLVSAGEISEVVYRDEAGQVQQVHDVLRDLFVRAGESFVLLGRGQLVRLDHLFSVNGQVVTGAGAA